MIALLVFIMPNLKDVGPKHGTSASAAFTVAAGYRNPLLEYAYPGPTGCIRTHERSITGLHETPRRPQLHAKHSRHHSSHARSTDVCRTSSLCHNWLFR